MPRRGTTKTGYAVDRGKRKRAAKNQTVKHKRKDRFKFREVMVRSLDELEKGGYLPTYKELKELFDNEKATVECCCEKGIMDRPTACPRCSKPVKMYARYTVRCRRAECPYIRPKTCQRCDSDDDLKVNGNNSNCVHCKWQWRPGVEYERSVFRGSMFQNCKLPKNEVMHCMWLWLNKVSSTSAAVMLGWHEDTAAHWYRFFRQMCSQMIDNKANGEGILLGGKDDDGVPIVVEIDESKFARRKYNRGRRVKGSWVIGMVERTVKRRCVMIVVEKRDATVCTGLIRQYIRPGGVIHSDSWGGYNPIPKMGMDYTHRKLNHSKEYVKIHPDGYKSHTQTIEGTWGAQKKSIPVSKRNGADLQDCLFEFMWRRDNAGNLWSGLLEGLSKVRYAIAELLRVDRVEDPWEPTDILVNVNDCTDYDPDDDTESEDEDDAAAVRTGGDRRQRVPIADAAPSVDVHRQRREEEQQHADQQAMINAALAPNDNDDNSGSRCDLP